MGQQSRKNTIKNYNLKNRSQINERQRQYDKKNKEKKQIYNKANKVKIIANKRKYNKKNQKKITCII